MSECVCVCVCVRERERERERVYLCNVSMCVCVCVCKLYKGEHQHYMTGHSLHFITSASHTGPLKSQLLFIHKVLKHLHCLNINIYTRYLYYPSSSQERLYLAS